MCLYRSLQWKRHAIGFMAGFNEHRSPLMGARQALDEISHEKTPTKRLENVFRNKPKIANQIGTLGGGNHFMEVRTLQHCHCYNYCKEIKSLFVSIRQCQLELC